MFSKTPTRSVLLSALALFSCLSLQAGSAAARSEAPVCEPLVKQLRWRPGFFGIRMWWEVAAEAMNHASAPCREAIAAGRAREVACALQSLDEQRASGGIPLKRFVYRLTCQLRVPEAGARILAGVREPGVYAECADALFAMRSEDPDAVALRELYLEGLRKEPLTTRLPASLLHPPFVEQLAPVLRAYDQAQQPRRDAIYRAMCVKFPTDSAETREACAGLAEREPQWAREKLLRGDVMGGLGHLSVLPPEQLAQFAPLLRQFDAEQRKGRDLLYAMLCRPPAAPVGELAASCATLVPGAEISWPKLNQKRLAEQAINAEIEDYYRSGRNVGVGLLTLSLLGTAHALLLRRRRAHPKVVI
jgi:hypothetical protein